MRKIRQPRDATVSPSASPSTGTNVGCARNVAGFKRWIDLADVEERQAVPA